MPLSFSQTASLKCPQCNSPFNAEIWLTVDAGERPDLVERCRDGSIHVVTCPNGHSGMLGAVLLYHDRAKKQLFLAFPAGMPEQQLQQTGGQLIQKLRGQMLILPGSSYLDAPQAIPLELLGAAIDDKLEEVMAEMQAQAEALQNDPVIGGALRLLQEQQPLVQAILSWMALEAWQDSKTFLQARGDLMTEDAERVLTAMLDLARAQNDPNAIDDLVVHQKILHTARTQGIEAAYENYAVEGENAEYTPDPRVLLEARLSELGIHSQEELDRVLPDHPELQELMRRAMDENPLLEAINHLADTASPQAVVQLVQEYPLLLGDDSLRILRDIITNAELNGDAALAKHMQERVSVLEQMRARAQ